MEGTIKFSAWLPCTINSNFRWPLVIDPGKQCATFLKYRDTNYLCALSPCDMECETIRLAILGALRLVCTVKSIIIYSWYSVDS